LFLLTALILNISDFLSAVIGELAC
jgi:hypothetical protein